MLLGTLLLSLPPSSAPAQEEDSSEAEDNEKDRRKRRKNKRGIDPKMAPRAAAASPRIRPDLGSASRPKSDPPESATSSKASSASPSGTEDQDEGSDEPWAGDGDSAATAANNAPPRKRIEPLPDDVRINIDYDDVDIKTIIKDFAHKTGRNFLVDGNVSGKITIHAPRAVTVDEAYEAFIVALDAAGFTTVVEARFKSGSNRGKPMLTRILSTSDAKSEPLEMYGTSRRVPDSAKLITRLVQVDNIPANEMQQVIQKWISGAGDITSYAPSNTLIITDSANNIRRVMELIVELDISAPQQKLEVIPIQYAEASQVLAIVQEIYGTDGSTSSSSKSSKASSRSKSRKKGRDKKKKGKSKKPSSASSSSVGEESSFIGKMMADERTNSILVLATEKSLVEVKELIARIDYEVDAQAGIHVIYLEHAKAEELSSTLNSLVQQSAGSSKSRGKANSKAKASSRGGKNDRQSSARSGAAGSLGGNFTGEVRVTHDISTNSLVITASRDDYLRMKKVIDLLDIPRKQVFVETVIMEVSDTTSKDNGVSWHGGGLASGDAGSATLIGARGGSSISPAASLLDGSLLAGLGLGIFGEALNIALPGVEGGLEIPAFGVILRFLQEDSSTNVLSSPNILTLDNEEAVIEVGETVPFPTGSTLGGLSSAAGAAGLGGLSGFPSVSFTRDDVGIILRITPLINESDWVTLDVYQEISEVKEGSTSDSVSSGGPTTTKRSAETHVSVRSNQTIVVGGLMQEVETQSESKVPILGDIPLIGALFRNKRKTKRKTNLLIFLTPHVIDSPADLQEIYRVKMLQREEFMKRFYGKSRTEQMDELNQLVRYSMNLPDTPSVFSDPTDSVMEIEVETRLPSNEDLLEALQEVELGDDEILITPDGEAILPEDEELEPEETEETDEQPSPASDDTGDEDPEDSGEE